ncbi:FAD-binding domain-containing protein [Rickenella mellea]|uniref:FAD-binding domain-containing protein n=1 Tax=Rickenella mellea TaxID=50990 RepID=A0A4Y7PRR5_9AGAM|nr:FAD-binding domain-containing protein [Rickenella mellea]
MLVFSLLTATSKATLAVTSPELSAAQTACGLLSRAFPQLVAFPGSPQYTADNAHYAVSSIQNSTCSIEPNTPQDVAEILRIVGRDDVRAPFAIKSGGHAYNIGQSSTTGIQLSLVKFNTVSYNPSTKTATIGTGLTWDQVYKQLEPIGVMVTGGRIPGIGVGGFSLGGGYSWKTDQFGLCVDTIVSFDVVLPSGQFTRVTNSSNPDLFFALKGGLNNFGIVTAITFETHPQTLVWGGTLIYTRDVADQVNQVVASFDVNNTDLKAQIIAEPTSIGGQFIYSVFLFYDAPNPPSGLFDPFLAIPAAQSAIKTQTFVEFLTSNFGDGTLGIGPFKYGAHVIPIVNYTPDVLAEMVEQVTNIGNSLMPLFNGSTLIVACGAEPFTKPFSHSRGGAYPHPPSRQVKPTAPFLALQAGADKNQEAILVRGVKQLSRNVQARAVQEGQSRWDDLLYPNYALFDTPLELMYGSNVARLKAIARKVDPKGIMRLTGGFKF